MIKTLRYKILAILFVSLMCFSCLGVMTINNATADTEKQVVSFFDIESTSLRITDQGMRWVAKMDEQTYANVTTNENVSLHFIIAPTVLIDAANGDYMSMPRKIQIDIEDYSKMYKKGEFWFVNGAVNKLNDANRNIPYSAVAVISTINGATIKHEYTSTKISYSAYSLVNKAIVDGGLEIETVSKLLETYYYVGTESFPIAPASNEEFANLVNLDDGEIFNDKVITLPYDGEEIVLFEENDKGYPSVITFDAENVLIQDESIVKYVDGNIVAGANFGNTLFNAVLIKDGLKVNCEIPVLVKSVPKVEIRAEDLSGFSNRNLTSNDKVIYVKNDNKELCPKVYVDDVLLDNDNQKFTWKFKQGAELLAVKDNGNSLSITNVFGNGTAIVEVGYVDAWGVKHVKDVAIDVNLPLWYGSYDKYVSSDGVAHQGIYARLPECNSGIRFDGVDYTHSDTAQLIRLQYIPEVETDYSFVPGPQVMYITIMDHLNNTNYVTFMARMNFDNYKIYKSQVGVRASTWGTYRVGGISKNDVSVVNSKYQHLTMGYGGGTTITANKFSFFGYYLGDSSSDKENAMIGLSVSNSSIFMHHAGAKTELMNFSEYVDITGKAGWDGFTGDKVDILVRFAYSEDYSAATIYVDTLGGKPVTGITNDMYFVGDMKTSVVSGVLYKD